MESLWRVPGHSCNKISVWQIYSRPSNWLIDLGFAVLIMSKISQWERYNLSPSCVTSCANLCSVCIAQTLIHTDSTRRVPNLNSWCWALRYAPVNWLSMEMEQQDVNIGVDFHNLEMKISRLTNSLGSLWICLNPCFSSNPVASLCCPEYLCTALLCLVIIMLQTPGVRSCQLHCVCCCTHFNLLPASCSVWPLLKKIHN